MRKMKIMAWLLSAMMVASCPVWAEETMTEGDNSDLPLVYCIAASQKNAYFAAVYEYAEEAGEELGYKVVCVSHDDDLQKQQEQVDAAISAGAVAIVLDNAGADASIETVRKAMDQGCPVFLVDREINESGVALCQITCDNYSAALAGGEYFAEMLEEEGEYAELLGLESDTAAELRTEGFHAAIDQYEDLEMVAQQAADWDRTKAYDKTDSILQAHPDLKGIVCGNDDMALGAMAACEAAGRNDIVIIGFDGTDEAIEAVREGKLAATLMDQIGVSVKKAFTLMDNYLKNGETGEDEKQLVDCLLVTPDNAENVWGYSLHDE